MSISSQARASEPRCSAPRHKSLILVAVCLGQFMVQLDLTIVNVALPSIGRDLGASVTGLQWVIDSYSLAVASLLLIGGRIGDRSGHKRVYLVGLVVFAVGSGLCALAPSGGWLIAFRVLQGIGAAIELPARWPFVIIGVGFEQAFTTGIHTALIVAGAVTLAGAAVAAAFIQTTANQQPRQIHREHQADVVGPARDV